MILTILVVVVIVSLIFEYINGFHDAANAIATVVSTKVLTPQQAVIYGAFFEIIGAFFGTHVAMTIGEGIISTSCVDQKLILCALAGAIIWNLFTWYFGIPSSSSHALIGGLIGSAFVKSGYNVINVHGVMKKVVIPMVTSPLIGFLIGFLVTLLLLWMFYKSKPDRVNEYFKKLQLVSAAFMAFGHGSNDAQKTMGIITLSLLSAGVISSFKVPVWVILACAITMGMGTMTGGWRIIKTMGSKIFKMKAIHGFAAQLSASIVILTCSYMGIPISTTHVISSSILGVGSTKRFSAVKWGIAGNILRAWIFTLPVCFVLSGLVYLFVDLIF